MNEKETCDLNSANVPLVSPGIVGTSVERDGQCVAFDYDPAAISDESVRQVAARLAPEAQRRFDKCVMRLGGRACEACALKLQRKAQKIEGVRRARATFIGGVMSAAFDNVQLSPDQVIEQVRETGAPVRPFTIPAELPRSIREWLQYHSSRIEAACTALTFIFMVTGWSAPHVGLGQTWATAFFTAAYITGGIFGVEASLQSLWQWTIDVDLLMILAALGAAVVGSTVRGSDAAVSVFALKRFAGLTQSIARARRSTRS